MAAGVNTPNADEATRWSAEAARRRRLHAAGPGRHLAVAVDARAGRRRRSRTRSGRSRPSVVLTGSRGHRRASTTRCAATSASSACPLAILDDDGAAARGRVGPYPPGQLDRDRAAARLRAGLPAADDQLRRPAALVEAMHGTATIESFTVDGDPVPGALDAPWRAAASQVGTPTGVRAPPRLEGGHLHGVLRGALARAPTPASARPTYPPWCPVLWGRTATQQTRLQTGSSGLFHGPLRAALPSRCPSAARRGC